MRILFLFVLLISAPLVMHGQKILKYSYDQSGNRTQRDTITIVTRSAVSIESFVEAPTERVLKIYPNPTQGKLFVEISNVETIKSVNLTIYNMQGRLVGTSSVRSGLTNLDISSQPNGVYILQINIDGEQNTCRIIKD